MEGIIFKFRQLLKFYWKYDGKIEGTIFPIDR